MMRKIDVVIVGAQKAGTTSLNNYLSEHPDILGHPQTEFAYFRDDNEYQQDFHAVFKRHFTNGNFSSKIVLAKNAGIYDNEKAIERLYNHNPKCKIIFVLREPVSRAISAYHMERFNGWLKRDLEEVKDVIEKEDYNNVLYQLFINMGLYSKHLKKLLNYFPKKNVKIYLFEELKSNTDDIYKDICNWIGVSNSLLPNLQEKHNPTFQPKSDILTYLLLKLRDNKNPIKQFVKFILPYSTFTKIGNYLIKSNKSKKKPKPISDDLKKYLHDYFKPYNNELREMTGLDLDVWDKNYNT